jgi:formate dehydrogenase subunit delta
MDPHRLIHMANQIGEFFAAEADHAAALDGIAGHIRRFWDPRMRREILQWVDEHQGEGLLPLVAEAIRTQRAALTTASSRTS